jgi:beta-lactamase regulating signal transducer with metallopeptidase domain
LQSPVTVAGVILLPADYREWSRAKREAVLAHEGAHVARGDFFVQLAAAIHRAFFWFSPFAWWLQSKLAQIAETASDDAAIQRLNDCVTYAEILIDVSRRAQRTPALVGMAKGPFIAQRVDHILSEAPARHLSLPLRSCIVAILAAVALAVAAAKAVVTAQAPVSPDPVTARKSVAAPSAPTAPTAPAATQSVSRSTTVAEHGAHSNAGRRDAARSDDAATYNPRALLDPAHAPSRSFVPPSTLLHAGTPFYVRSNEQPVAEVTASTGVERPPPRVIPGDLPWGN